MNEVRVKGILGLFLTGTRFDEKEGERYELPAGHVLAYHSLFGFLDYRRRFCE